MTKLILIFFTVGIHLCVTQLIHNQHVGCFKDDEGQRDLTFSIPGIKPTVQECVDECMKHYYMYAGLQDGGKCFCGSSYGKYGPGTCQTRCTGNQNEICGGTLSNTVYRTDVLVPGPASNLQLNETKENSLSITWVAPDAPEDFVTEYNIYAQINKTFDTFSPVYAAKHIQLSETSRSTSIIGLMPGSLYNVTVVASSKNGPGPPISQLFWTEIGTPDTPDAPQFIHREGDDAHGEIHVKLVPLERNRKGPISAYRVVVIDETDPAPFHEENLYNWTLANEEGINYWIAAELGPAWFNTNEAFVVGDGQTYGGYWNYGPLTVGRDYHVTVGVVSHLNNVTKASYARVTHEQHATENIVVFEFRSHDEDYHDHDHGDVHDHGVRRIKTKPVSDGRTIATPTPVSGQSDALAIGLSVAVAICGLVFAGVLGFYIHLRRSQTQGSRGDIQELTTHAHLNGDVETMANGFATEDAAPVKLEVLRTRVWSIPRNFLEMSHEVVGRGRFGSLVKGHVNKRGQLEPCNVQVVPGKILEEEEMQAMTASLELVIRYGSHPNLIQLIGLCEDKETIFVVLEEGTLTLKQVLLDSRALIHHPVFAEKNQRFSSLKEESAMDILIGIANGMNHLAQHGIFHRKLCARNIFMCNNVPKIGGIGIGDYSKPGQESDFTRWSAQETFQSKSYVSKCDAWAFAILMWEVLTLGGTPYSEVKTRDVPSRVTRGLRVPQTQYMSDDLYQIMLQCWEIDLDERPEFEQLAYVLADLAHQGNNHINFATFPGFQYEDFVYDLECH